MSKQVSSIVRPGYDAQKKALKQQQAAQAEAQAKEDAESAATKEELTKKLKRGQTASTGDRSLISDTGLKTTLG
jgi:hypothetical protein